MSSERHYNKVAQHAPVQCRQLRRSHNKCKHQLIRRAIELAQVPLSQCNIADLACGRGGDINKIRGCRSYVGADTALHALAELTRRAAEIQMNVQLHHIDASRLSILPCSIDVAMCNFALHYFCDSQQHCSALLDTIERMLRPGGVFCGTYEKVRGTVSWGTAHYAQIGDCVDALEWRVPWQQLQHMCVARKMAIVFHMPFHMIDPEADNSIHSFIIQKAQVQCTDTQPTSSLTTDIPRRRQDEMRCRDQSSA